MTETIQSLGRRLDEMASEFREAVYLQLLILADALEESGDCQLACSYRWLVEQRKWPYWVMRDSYWEWEWDSYGLPAVDISEDGFIPLSGQDAALSRNNSQVPRCEDPDHSDVFKHRHKRLCDAFAWAAYHVQLCQAEQARYRGPGHPRKGWWLPTMEELSDRRMRRARRNQ